MSLFNFSEFFHSIVGKHQLFRFNKEKKKHIYFDKI